MQIVSAYVNALSNSERRMLFDMGMILTLTTHIILLIFLGRLFLHALSWIKAEKMLSFRSGPVNISAGTIAEALLDIIFFRRLFRINRALWLASWTFHISLFLIILRHLRYFLYPVPELVLLIQDAGIYAGYILPASVLFLLVLRLHRSRDRYVSPYNLFLLIAILLTTASGLLLTLAYRINIVDAKAFTMDIVALTPGTMPDSALFMFHYLLFLILILSLPFHLVAAPVTTMDARRRDDELNMVLHEK